MATKVLDLEFTALPEQVTGLTGYEAALCLIRYHRKPVTRIQIPVRNDCITGADLREALLKSALPELCEGWFDWLLGRDPVDPASAPLPQTTVAVCTRDRPEDLRQCLESLQRLPDDGQEILVIDNCPSTDAAERLACEYRRCRYVRENRPGLNFARNRALREATGAVIAFIDDDAVAEPCWLRAVLSGFEDPLVMAVTGPIMPLELETEAQELFEQMGGLFRGFRRCRYSLDTHNPLAGGSAGSGANMAVRRELIEKVGLFDEALDAGTVTRSGGDTEMLTRILSAGFEIVYQPDALNWHRHRRTRQELKAAVYGYGVGLYAAWTHRLFAGKEWAVLKAAWSRSWRLQAPRILSSLLRRPGAWPLDLALAELWGTFAGPFAYWRARHRLRSQLQP
jgi:GT2 family glycosyltransferase